MGPTIPVFACARVEAQSVLTLPGALFTPSMSQFEQVAAGSLIGVVVCPPPDRDSEVYRWLQAMTISHPAAAIVCVTRFEEDWLQPLARVSCAAILSADHGNAFLERKISELMVPDVRRLLDQLSANAWVLARPCADAMTAMCDATRDPIVDVATLPGVVSLSPSAFYKAWEQDFPDCTPKHVVDWIALARARRRTRTATAAARFLHLDLRTVQRMWLRCTRRPMSVTLDPDGLACFIRDLSACAEPVLRRALERRRAG